MAFGCDVRAPVNHTGRGAKLRRKESEQHLVCSDENSEGKQRDDNNHPEKPTQIVFVTHGGIL